jgi:hypothetical protein
MFKVPLRYVKSVVLPTVDDFEIVRRIVHPVAIYVMNMLPSLQGTTKLQFHYDSIDGDSSVLSGPGSVYVPIVVVDARTSAVDGQVFFDVDLAIVRNRNVAHVFDNSTRSRVFQVVIGDVWTHILHTVDAAAELAARDGLAADERALLVFAALCHDLGKPATTTVEPDGRIRSLGHDRAGVAPAEAFLGRIGSPRALVARVTPLVREHMAHTSADASDRAIRRLAVRLAPATIAQWGRLVEADRSGRPPLPPANPAAATVERARLLGAAEGKPAPILRGRHLIDAGVPPGPRVGQILARAYEAQIKGKFATVEQGLAWVAKQAVEMKD